MANWFRDKKDEELPESVRGKTPEQLAQELKDAQALKDQVAAAQAEAQRLKDADASRQTEFDAVKTKLAALEAAARTNNNNNNQNQPLDLEKFMADPEKTLNDEINKRVGPFAQTAVLNAAQTARILAQQQLNNQDLASGGKTMDGRLFQAWASEIDAQVKNYRTDQMVTPQAWLGVYMFIKGTHADELADADTRKKKYGMLEPVRSNVSSGNEGAEKPASDQLTPQELKIAERMKVTPEAYLKRKKSMQMSAA